MPATERAARITDAYRAAMVRLRDRARTLAASRWGIVTPEDLDASHAEWTVLVAPALVELQRAGARLSAGYLAAYLTAELGRPQSPHGASAAALIGVSRAGKPMVDAQVGSLIAVKVAIRDGHDPSEALQFGLDRASRNAGEDVLFATRGALDAGMRADDRIVGWRRVTHGGCGACIAAATGAVQHEAETLPVHDNCRCTKEPVVRDAPDRYPRPTGGELFHGLSAAQQDHLLGPEKAQLVRSGRVPLHSLIAISPMAAIPDQITERSLADLLAQAA